MAATNSNAPISCVHISTGMVDLDFKYLSLSINKVHLCLFYSETEKALDWHVFVSLITVLAKSFKSQQTVLVESSLCTTHISLN